MSREPECGCPICRADSRYIFTSRHDRRICECSNRDCGHFFTPVVHETQGVCVRSDDLPQESDASLKIYDERNARLLALFLRRRGPLSRPIVFLDFGAGDAHVSRTFKTHLQDRCEIYCLEPNPACEGFYERHGLIQVRGLDSIPGGVDFVYMIEVVEHLEDPVGTLRGLRGVMSDGALLFLSTPEGSRHSRETHAYDTPSHLHFFTPRSLNRALSAAGFEEIDYRRYPEMYPRPGSAAGRLMACAKDLVRPLAWAILRPHVKHKDLAGFTRPAVEQSAFRP